MNDRQLLRYSRHLLLNEIGLEGQQTLLNSTVLVVGCGGLGSAALPYLAAAGIGTLLIADPDCVDDTNLQRQTAYREQDIGRPKAEAMADCLRARNHDCRIESHTRYLDSGSLKPLLTRCQAVLDCSDNAATRQTVNAAACAARVPLISGAASGFSGQLAVFRFDRPAAPCYACLFGSSHHRPETACATFGVFAPLVGIIGSAQAADTLKLLLNLPVPDTLRCYDGLSGTWQAFRFARQADCPICTSTPLPARDKAQPTS